MAFSVLTALDERQSAAVAELVERVRRRSGRSPLNEESLLALSSPPGSVRHVLATGQGPLSGYAIVLGDGEPWRAQLVIDPGAAGLADRLVAAVLELVAGRPLQIWTHGPSDIAPALRRAGLVRRRTLLTMARPLDPPPESAPVPDGFRLRPFRVGADEEAWLSGNAAAFAALPDQGGWGLPELTARLAQPWFDADGFLLLEAGDELAGFCWTKRHRDAGEIYVFAVLPQYRHRGLAVPLLSAGLRHLRDRGCGEAILFVDESNTSAVRLYTRAGFRVRDTDVLYATDR